jgi:hypothetical protein
LLRVAERIGAALRSAAPKLRPRPALSPLVDAPFRPVLLVDGCGGRGPAVARPPHPLDEHDRPADRPQRSVEVLTLVAIAGAVVAVRILRRPSA